MSRRGLVGFAAAACVACCAGPFLAALGGIAAMGVIGWFAFGIGALAIAGVVLSGMVAMRARRHGSPDHQPVDLGPTRR